MLNLWIIDKNRRSKQQYFMGKWRSYAEFFFLVWSIFCNLFPNHGIWLAHDMQDEIWTIWNAKRIEVHQLNCFEEFGWKDVPRTNQISWSWMIAHVDSTLFQFTSDLSPVKENIPPLHPLAIFLGRHLQSMPFLASPNPRWGSLKKAISSLWRMTRTGTFLMLWPLICIFRAKPGLAGHFWTDPRSGVVQPWDRGRPQNDVRA